MLVIYILLNISNLSTYFDMRLLKKFFENGHTRIGIILHAVHNDVPNPPVDWSSCMKIRFLDRLFHLKVEIPVQ